MPAAAPHNLPQFAVPAAQFLGREVQLERLRELLAARGRVAVVAIAGMGGIGKTELVLQYALRGAARYPGGICWLQAQGEISDRIAGLAREFHGLAVPEEFPEHRRPRWCWQQWPQQQTLVIYDDVSNYAAVQAWLPPKKKQFHVILTSRLQEPVNLAQLDVDVLAPAAALQLLQKRVGAARIEAECSAAEQLCAWLGYLPLGLVLVGSYLARRTDRTVAQVWTALQERGKPSAALQAPLELAWEQLSPPGQLLLVQLGLFASVPFAWDWVGEGEELRDRELLPGHWVRSVTPGTYRLHPSLREFLQVKRQRLPEAGTLVEDFCRQMANIARQIPQGATSEVVARFRGAVPHLREVTERHLAAIDDEDLLDICAGLTFFYSGRGSYEAAREVAELCVETVRSRLGTNHPSYAASLSYLAYARKSQG